MIELINDIREGMCLNFDMNRVVYNGKDHSPIAFPDFSGDGEKNRFKKKGFNLVFTNPDEIDFLNSLGLGLNRKFKPMGGYNDPDNEAMILNVDLDYDQAERWPIVIRRKVLEPGQEFLSAEELDMIPFVDISVDEVVPNLVALKSLNSDAAYRCVRAYGLIRLYVWDKEEQAAIKAGTMNWADAKKSVKLKSLYVCVEDSAIERIEARRAAALKAHPTEEYEF